MNRIDALRKVVTHNLCNINGAMDYFRLTQAITKLANTIASSETSEDIWWLGEGDYISLDDLIVGAYWHYVEWHEGMCTASYGALCALGEVFQPNMSDVETDNEAYILLNEMAGV